jgi:hypothetical protein
MSTPGSGDRRSLVSELRSWLYWLETGEGDKPKTLVFVPLKTNGLEKTAVEIEKAFEVLQQDLPLLFVDDESDSASPNNKAQGNLKSGLSERSTTSKRVNRVFKASTQSKYLMYTATPQANLLMNLKEELNPEFCHVLDPGSDYFGFEEFFLSKTSTNYLRLVPNAEIVGDRTQRFPDHDTAILAMAVFITGCAIQLASGKFDVSITSHVRSMMMQVAQSKSAHKHFYDIAETIAMSWKESFSANPELSENYHFFRKAHEDLKLTNAKLPTLEELHPAILKVLKHLKVELLNSENMSLKDGASAAQDRVKWSEAAFWILVGGMYLDRGFTVNGLQVTFMPRSPAKNEDSITQRARFFGYHAEYKSFIRIYMPFELQETYLEIGKNALDLREQMKDSGGDLVAWERDFRLARGVEPTRKSVVGRHLSTTSENWMNPQLLHQISDQERQANLQLIVGARQAIAGARNHAEGNLTDYGIYNQAKARIFEGIPLEGAAKLLLAFSHKTEVDGPQLINKQLDEAKKLGFVTATLVFIDDLDTKRLTGKILDPVAPIGNGLWSGASSRKISSTARKYPGDRLVFNNAEPTIQLRIVRAKWYGLPEEGLDFAWWAWRNPTQEKRLRESHE